MIEDAKEAPAEAPVVISAAISEYSATTAALADLQHRFGGVVFDLTTTKGARDARAARFELVRLRSALEEKRKEVKIPALERARLIDAEAARIKGAILSLETPIDLQITLDEQRREAARKAREEVEAARVAQIRSAIDEINGQALRAVGLPPAAIEESIRWIVGFTIGPEFAEFKEQAERASASALATLRSLLEKAVAAEQEAARIADERAQLERDREADRLRRVEIEAEASRLAQQVETARAVQAQLDREAAAERVRADRAQQQRARRLTGSPARRVRPRSSARPSSAPSCSASRISASRSSAIAGRLKRTRSPPSTSPPRKLTEPAKLRPACDATPKMLS